MAGPTTLLLVFILKLLFNKDFPHSTKWKRCTLYNCTARGHIDQNPDSNVVNWQKLDGLTTILLIFILKQLFYKDFPHSAKLNCKFWIIYDTWNPKKKKRVCSNLRKENKTHYQFEPIISMYLTLNICVSTKKTTEKCTIHSIKIYNQNRFWKRMGWDKLSNEKPHRNSKNSEDWLHQNVEERLINTPKWKTRTIEREFCRNFTWRNRKRSLSSNL